MPPTGSGPTTNWPPSCPERTAILHVGSISSWTAPGSDAIARLVDRVARHGALISVDPNIRPPLADGPVGATPRQHRAPSSASAWTGWSRRADVVKVSAEDLEWLEPDGRRRRTWTPPRSAGPTAGRPWSCSPTAAGRCGSPARAARCCTASPPRVTVADTVGAGDSLAAGLLSGLLAAGVTTRAALEALPDDDLLARRRRRRAGRRAQLHPGRRRPADPGGAGRRPSRPVTDDVRVVGFAELSATTVRARLLDAHDRFWDTDTRALHHPVWFHQFGGFGALAMSDDGEDVGYVLGVVTADRLAYLHLLAVRDDRRRSGLGTRLVPLVRRARGVAPAPASSRR